MLFLLIAAGAMAAGWTMSVRRARRLIAEAEHTVRMDGKTARGLQIFAWELDLQTQELRRVFGDLFGGLGDGTSGPLNQEQFFGYMHPDDRKMVGERMQALIEKGSPLDEEYRILDASGTTRWLHTVGDFASDPRGRPVVVGFTQDVTARRQAEHELRELKDRMERAVTGSTDALFDVDLRTGEAWTGMRWAELLGYTDRPPPKSAEETALLIHPDDLEPRSQAMRDHLEGRTPLFDVEYRMRHQDGSWRWFRSRASCVFDSNGERIKLSGMLQDITDKKRYQEALLEATEVAAAANRAKSEFLANMSHEIRTPMNGVIGMCELLNDTPLDRVQREYVDTIRASGSTLLTVINDILDFSKIEAGKLELEHIDVDLRDSMDHVARVVSVQAQAKNLRIAVQVDADVPALVQGDPGRVRQVLLNLASNAVKFTQVGEVAFELRVAERTDSEVTIHGEVRDTGVGIPADRVHALFQPFTQADSSTTRRFGGTGLGLSIARHLVQLMRGEMGVRSEHGVGSTFWFKMRFGISPAANLTQPSRSIASSDPGALQPSRNARVLLVEDNAVNRKVARRLVEKLGFQVETRNDGDEALEALEHETFELILMDCQMPVRDGYETTREIRRREAGGRRTPIVALTAHAMKGAEQACLDAGMDAYLSKPLDSAALAATLRRYLVGSNVAAGPSVVAPIDWESLVQTADHDTALMRDLVTLFVADTAASLESVSGAMRRADFDLLRRELHNIKGASVNMQAQPLSELAQRAEEAVNAGEHTRVGVLVRELQQEMERTIEYLRAKSA